MRNAPGSGLNKGIQSPMELWINLGSGMKPKNRTLEIGFDVIFAVVPALFFMPFVLTGILWMARAQSFSVEEFLTLAIMFSAILATAALLIGVCRKANNPEVIQTDFVRIGTFVGSAACLITLVAGVFNGVWVALVLVFPIYIGSKYFRS
ncbi:MAG: hypothetical protein ABWY06_22740 [Pseudomonas sp.]|uniref:hypothetical protein n=1 Tax=Pseudomonas sp. TaxID=306 RepID=UPI00339640B0